MKLLFLRGRVPQDRDPRQIMFDSLEECDDVWTQLAARLAAGGYGEVWYWGGQRRVEYRDNFTERWIQKFGATEYDFDPDVIFARGGFAEYDCVLQRHPRAFKIYYGAGRRFLPASAFTDYDLILNDSPNQLETAKKRYPYIKSSLFIKPAAENIFHPVSGHKEHDVIFVGNEMLSGIKGHGFMLPRIPSKLSMVQVGIASDKLRRTYSHIRFTGWIPRRMIPSLYGKARVAICGCDAIDSCPRIIPEAMACGCPLLVLDSVRFWHDKYITEASGAICSKEEFGEKLLWMVENHERFSPYDHYQSNLSMDMAVKHLRRLIAEPLRIRIADSYSVDRIVEDHFGKPSSSHRLSSLARHIVGDGYDMKLETYRKNPKKVSGFCEPGNEWNTVAAQHKLDRSLPVHIDALVAGLRVPRIVRIVEQGRDVHKFTEWIPGNAVAKELKESPGKLGTICRELGRYAATLHAENITAVDNHLENFVWSERGVVYVDMKKLLYCRDEVHALMMLKFCVKSCRGDRRKAINFLRGYSEIRSVVPILCYCDEMGWRMANLGMDRITLEDVEGA